MRVKRYIARSVQEALEKIRVDLGKDAIILNTKKVRKGGFLGLFKKEQFEVIAAIDQDKPKSINENSSNMLQQKQMAHELPLRSTSDFQRPKNKVYTNEALRESTHNKTEGELLQEVKEMREMFVEMMKKKGEEDIPIAFQGIYKRLREQEVEEGIITLLIQEAVKKHPLTILNEKQIYQLIRKEIIHLFHKRFVHGINPFARLYHFVGPTGVGKTTTIAKLAADFVINHHKKVALVTSDTYRIAAIDQLKTYASILNAPLEVVFNSSDLHQSVLRLAGNDLILMDTAGRNYRDSEYTQELSKLLTSSIPAETFLVLSLTSKYSDMVSLIKEFEKIGVNKVIFTKMDETTTYGSILNIFYFYNLQLSYLTNGQNVPDDIITASPEYIADLILGGDHV